MCESNYPDWCVGRAKGEYIDGCAYGAFGAVIREDILCELEELEREREEIEDKIAELEQMLGRIDD